MSGQPTLAAVIVPLLGALQAITDQMAALDRQALALARGDGVCRRLMAVPAIAPITGLAFRATLDDPSRFARSRSVGAYVGLTPRRYRSGEIDHSGRVSRCGDAMLRGSLFEATGVLLTRIGRWSRLKARGTQLAKRLGLRKATDTVARKLAVLLHRLWADGSIFRWSDAAVSDTPSSARMGKTGCVRSDSMRRSRCRRPVAVP